jgi:PBP superfamily domain
VDRSRIYLTLKQLFLRLFLIVPILFFLGEGYGHTGEIVAIVNPNNPLEHLDLNELKNIYKGEVKYWESGERVVLFLPPASSEPMNALTTKVFRKKNSKAIFKFYLKAIFQQKFDAPPKSATSTISAINSVVSAPGGIAIVNGSEIPDSSQIKALSVDGL